LILSFSECALLHGGDNGEVMHAIGKCFGKGLRFLNLQFWGCKLLRITDVSPLVIKLPDNIDYLQLNFSDTELPADVSLLDKEKAYAWRDKLRTEKAEFERSPSMEFSALKEEEEMEVLRMRTVDFKDEELHFLADAIPQSLRELSIDFTDCDDMQDEAAFEKFASALPESLEIIDLNFAYCIALNDDCVSLLAQAFPPELQILQLNLQGIQLLGDEGLAAIGYNMPSRLKVLRLSVIDCDEITDDGVRAISTGVSKARFLDTLDLQFNYCDAITDESLEYLSYEISDCLPMLHELQLCFKECTSITSFGIAACIRDLPDDMHKLSLNFGGADLQSESGAWEHFADKFEDLEILTELQIGVPNVKNLDDTSFKKLTCTMPMNLTTLKLDVRGSQISDNSLIELGKAMQAGQVTIRIIGAKALSVVDSSDRCHIDTFVRCEVYTRGKRRLRFETHVSWHSAEPLWLYTYESSDICVGDELHFFLIEKMIKEDDHTVGAGSLKGGDWINGYKGAVQLTPLGKKFRDGELVSNLALQVSVQLEPSSLNFLDTLDLDCSECPNITDQGIIGLTSRLSNNLKDVTLNFHGCSKITHKGTLALYQNFPDLGPESLRVNIFHTGTLSKKDRAWYSAEALQIQKKLYRPAKKKTEGGMGCSGQRTRPGQGTRCV
jgi:hypothetical protein